MMEGWWLGNPTCLAKVTFLPAKSKRLKELSPLLLFITFLVERTACVSLFLIIIFFIKQSCDAASREWGWLLFPQATSPPPHDHSMV